MRAENPTLIIQIEKEIIENLIPIFPEPKRNNKKASLVPRFPVLRMELELLPQTLHRQYNI